MSKQICNVFMQSLLLLEKELSYLGGMCSASLLQRDLLLPFGKATVLRYYYVHYFAIF